MKTSLTTMLLIILIGVTQFSNAHNLEQPIQANNPVLTPIYGLFDAMREHNKDKLLAQFTAQAILQRVTAKGEIINSDVKKFAQSISENTAKLDEHVLAVNIHQEEGLASVWTPFAFYLNDNLSHCGSNSIQLVKMKGQWKIHYLIDVTYTGDCQTFVAKYTSP